MAYLACHNGGATDASTAMANTWAMFSPRNVCAWDENSRSYDRALHYYLHYNENITVSSLLSSGDGQCGAWALLFRDCLSANGIRRRA